MKVWHILIIHISLLTQCFLQVYLPAIEGYVPQDMVQALRAFLECCYIVRRNILDTNSLRELEDALERYHTYRKF